MKFYFIFCNILTKVSLFLRRRLWMTLKKIPKKFKNWLYQINI